MKKHLPILATSLLCCLFIYVFYRTEKTLVNQLILHFFSLEDYSELRTYINQSLPLNDQVIYSLPEGLWVFCITLTSGLFYFQLGKRKISLVLLPVLIATAMELCQLLNLSGGRFDWTDVLFIVVFWLLGVIFPAANGQQELSFARCNRRTLLFLGTYMIVYLAHVSV